MYVDEVSCRAIGTGQEFRNLGRWSWMFLQGNNNMRTIIINTYFPTSRASTGGVYIQQLESLYIMKIQNDPRIQFWIDLNKEISKWIHKGEQIILMGDWNSEALEVNTWMETQAITNTICKIHGYLNAPITYQQSKYCPIDSIYCLASLEANWGGFLSF